jgi:hypothetical protein
MDFGLRHEQALKPIQTLFPFRLLGQLGRWLRTPAEHSTLQKYMPRYGSSHNQQCPERDEKTNH